MCRFPQMDHENAYGFVCFLLISVDHPLKLPWAMLPAPVNMGMSREGDWRFVKRQRHRKQSSYFICLVFPSSRDQFHSSLSYTVFSDCSFLNILKLHDLRVFKSSSTKVPTFLKHRFNTCCSSSIQNRLHKK